MNMNIKQGDRVVLYPGSITPPRLSTVERVTPSGQVVLSDYSFRFYSNGRQVGDRPHSSVRIEEATPAACAAMEQEAQRRRQNIYMQRLRTALQMYTQELNMVQIEELLDLLGIPLPPKG
jgi:hypothetical protein